MKALAIIPARADSARLPSKNVQMIAGKSLVQHAIDHAFAAKSVAHVLVTTDSRAAYHIAKQMICPVHWRDPELCTGEVEMIDVVRDAVHVQMMETGGDFDAIVILQPTSPMRSWSDVDTALNILDISERDSVISVTNEPSRDVFTTDMNGNLWPVPGSRGTLVPNGAIFAIKREAFEAGRTWWDKPAGYYMPPHRSIDIDTMADLLEARRIMGDKA